MYAIRSYYAILAWLACKLDSFVSIVRLKTVLFNIPLFGSMNMWNAVAIGLIATLIMTKRSAVRSAVTVVYGVWLGIYLWTFVPATY